MQDEVVTNIDTHMCAVTLRPIVHKNQIKRSRARGRPRVQKVLPQVAGAEIGDYKTKMAEECVGVLLTVGAAVYSANIRCTWEMPRIVSHTPKVMGDGNWRGSEFCGSSMHCIASLKDMGRGSLPHFVTKGRLAGIHPIVDVGHLASLAPLPAAGG